MFIDWDKRINKRKEGLAFLISRCSMLFIVKKNGRFGMKKDGIKNCQSVK